MQLSELCIQQVNPSDYHNLNQFLEQLGTLTKNRFQPHKYDLDSIITFYYPYNYNQGFIVCLPDKQTIIAYAIIHYGYLLHDAPRINAYGLQLNHLTDCFYAPSVADEWQGKGLGRFLFESILFEIRSRGFKRIFLWGGVQSDNFQAIKYYEILGFNHLGSFEYQGMNLDMMKEIK